MWLYCGASVNALGVNKPLVSPPAEQQLYAEDLGPAEEVESDRQQRVYRGQPSSLGQVARDRDGLRHQPNTIQVGRRLEEARRATQGAVEVGHPSNAAACPAPVLLQAPSSSRDKVSVISYATQQPPQYRYEPRAPAGQVRSTWIASG